MQKNIYVRNGSSTKKDLNAAEKRMAQYITYPRKIDKFHVKNF